MNAETQKPTNVMVVCPKCNVAISEHRLKKHLKAAHSVEREQRSIGLPNLRAVNAALEVYLATLICCSACRRNIKIKDIKSHFATVHCSPASADMLALVGLSEPTNMFKSAREREKFWREKAGIKNDDSDDLFDRTKVLSGGAFGLGKSRKH